MCSFAAAQARHAFDEVAAETILRRAMPHRAAMSIVYAIAGLGTPELLIIVVVLGLLLAVFAGMIRAVVWFARRR